MLPKSEQMSQRTMERQKNDECPNYSLYFTIHGHKSSISSVKFSPCGNFLASASFDKYVKIWDSTDGNCEKDLIGHKLGCSDISWSYNSAQLASASDDKTLKIWNNETGHCKKTLKGHTDYVFCTSFDPSAKFLLSGSDDQTARFWDVHEGKCIKTLDRHAERVTAVDFNSVDRNLLLTSSLDGFCHIYDKRTWEILHTFGDGQEISYAKFSKNGCYVLASSTDSTIRLWQFNKATPKCVKQYTGHQNRKYSIFADFVSGGKYVVGGSEDNKVYIWALNSKTLVQTLDEHSGVVLSVSCHPSKNIIASGALLDDKSIKIWRAL